MKTKFFCLMMLAAILSCKKSDPVAPAPKPVVPTPVLSTEKEITSFNFTKAANPQLTADVTATIDATNHTISATFPYGTAVTALKASFVLSANATLKLGSTAQTSAVTANDFTNPLTFTVTAQNGTTQNYVATVKIETTTNTTSNLVIKREEFAPGPPVQTVPIQTIDYTYNASNQLISFKDIGGSYVFDYDANGVLKAQTVKDNSGNISNTLTYTLNTNKLPTIVAGTYGQTLENYYYGTSGQLIKYTKSYYGAVKDTYEYTSDGKNRVITAKYTSKNDASDVYSIYTYEYYDDIFDPNPMVKVAISPGIFGGMDPATGKVYALKSYSYQKYNMNGPTGARQNYAYTYTTNSNGIIINTLEGSDVRVKYTFK